MFTITILTTLSKEPLVLMTDVRSQSRIVVLVCKENGLPVEVTEEVKPRIVKFKGVD